MAGRGASHQVEVEVHVRPGYARHTVKPEAGDRGEILLERHHEIVLVRHVLVIIAEEELGERFNLPEYSRLEIKPMRCN